MNMKIEIDHKEEDFYTALGLSEEETQNILRLLEQLEKEGYETHSLKLKKLIEQLPSFKEKIVASILFGATYHKIFKGKGNTEDKLTLTGHGKEAVKFNAS